MDVKDKIKKAMKEALRDHVEEDYPDIPFNQLHDGVEQAIRDWQEETDGDEPLLYWILGGPEGGVGTPPYKMSKDQSSYTDAASDPGTSCATCEFLYQKTTTGEHICSQIRGKVEPEGWCNQYEQSHVYNES